MDFVKKVAYIKGLAEGLGIDADKKEGKVITAMLDVLEEMADALTDVWEEVDAISEDLSDVEEVVFDDDECCCDDDECCCDDDDEDDDCCHHHHHHHCCDDEPDDEEVQYVADCPNCKAEVLINQEDLDAGFITCPECGEKLEFEFDEDDEDSGEKAEDKKDGQ